MKGNVFDRFNNKRINAVCLFLLSNTDGDVLRLLMSKTRVMIYGFVSRKQEQ